MQPISIFLDGPAYKSIRELSWEDIPGLAVLTGLNGSGKSQLLEILAMRPTGSNFPGKPHININIRIEGEQFRQGDIAYVPANQVYGGASPVTLAAMQQIKSNILAELQNHAVQNNVQLRARKARIEKIIGRPVQGLTLDQLNELLPNDYSFMLDDVNVVSNLGLVFFAYRIKLLQLIERKCSKEEALEEAGPAPWLILNDILQTAAFPYRIDDPSKIDILQPYTLKLLDILTAETRDPDDLSSGEKVILELVLWLFNTRDALRLPKLLILDEPDAHLHPSMTRQFIDVLHDVLVKKYGVRVILATHSPSTVALAPEESLFELRRGSRNVTRSISKADTLGLLSSGLVIVSPGTRYVLVEDQDDIDFYGAIRDILSDFGPSRLDHCLKASPSLVFLPASSGRSKEKIGGGCRVVSQWVEKFDHDPLTQLFRGLIDRDKANVSAGRVYVTARYSIENYLLDPLNIFCLLNERGDSPKISDLEISRGDEHLIRRQTRERLQAIVSVICERVQEENRSVLEGQELCEVPLTNDFALMYPRWMLEHRGHDLLPLFQKSWGSPQTIHFQSLLGSLRRLRLMPLDLASLLLSLQT